MRSTCRTAQTAPTGKQSQNSMMVLTTEWNAFGLQGFITTSTLLATRPPCTVHVHMLVSFPHCWTQMYHLILICYIPTSCIVFSDDTGLFHCLASLFHTHKHTHTTLKGAGHNVRGSFLYIKKMLIISFNLSNTLFIIWELLGLCPTNLTLKWVWIGMWKKVFFTTAG